MGAAAIILDGRKWAGFVDATSRLGTKFCALRPKAAAMGTGAGVTKGPTARTGWELHAAHRLAQSFSA